MVGSGRHPVEMKPHCSITPTTAWKGDFALVETNLKLFTSTRNGRARVEAHNTYPTAARSLHHHLQINEGPVRRGRTQPKRFVTICQPGKRLPKDPQFPRRRPTSDFAVAHHRTQSRGVRTECSVEPSSNKTPALCWLILEPPRRSAKPRRNRRVNGDNRRPRPGTDVKVYPQG